MSQLLRILSDLHLEFGDFEIPKSTYDYDTILILAGDITVANKQVPMERFVNLIDRACKQFKHVIYIMGNHEHYDCAFTETPKKIKKALKPLKLTNFTFLNNSSVIIENIAFIGTTLWTSANDRNPITEMTWSSMNDSRTIRYGKGDPYQSKFNCKFMVNEHEKAKTFLFTEIAKHKRAGLTTVCIVHHGVTYKSIADENKTPNDFHMNFFFHSDLFNELFDHNPDLVVHGHVHTAFDYYLDESLQQCQTRVVVNPRGYVGHENQERIGFNPLKIVEI